MANPQKQKGTTGEREVLTALRAAGFAAERTPPGTNYDIRVGEPGDGGLDVLATRPDHGEWLVTLRLDDFLALVQNSAAYYDIANPPVNVEVKRYTRFALHKIFTSKFGRK